MKTRFELKIKTALELQRCGSVHTKLFGRSKVAQNVGHSIWGFVVKTCAETCVKQNVKIRVKTITKQAIEKAKKPEKCLSQSLCLCFVYVGLHGGKPST